MRLPLVRGGTAQTVTVTGTGLDNIKVQVVRGGRVVSDVTASVRRISPTSFKVTLTAPSNGQSVGSDYKLRVLSGNKVIRETGFAVEAPAIQTPTQPTMRPAPAPGVIRR